eukprot:m.168418 g.168418  ORF g.168418 m.168418 type:complete len:466 (+) comp31515_c1_seq2:185-1582(+)
MAFRSARTLLRAAKLRGPSNKLPKEPTTTTHNLPKHNLPKPVPVLFEDVARATTRIAGGVVKTDLRRSHWLSVITGADVYLKHEQMQFTGSFKERGARNALLQLTEDQRKAGVMAASAGNHALALSWHGKQLGIPVTVFMPKVAPMAKVERCRSFGVNVVIHGANIGEAKQFAESQPEYKDLTYINGYDDPAIIAGAGTVGMEIIEQLPDVDFVLVPTGGVGLLAGVSLAVKTLRPLATVIGVEAKACASYNAALLAGHPIFTPTSGTLADGLAVPTVGTNAFAVARKYCDDNVQVSEKQIALSMLRLLENEKIVIEGAGATGLASILPGGPCHERCIGKKVAVPLCGGNMDITTLGRVIERGLSADQRLVRFTVEVLDQPGGIAGIANTLADLGASVKDIFHERAWLHASVDRVQIKVVIETVGEEHARVVRSTLENNPSYILVAWQHEVFSTFAEPIPHTGRN